MRKSILQIGQLPPPYGGISTHIAALKQNLDKFSIKNKVVKFKSLKFLYGLLRYHIIHSHALSFWSKVLLPLTKFCGKRVILSLHGDGLEDQLTENQVLKLNSLGKKILRKTLLFYDAFIVSNEKIKKFLQSLGINSDIIYIIPEFIPVDSDWNYKKDRPEIDSFINNRKMFFLSGDLRIYNNTWLYGYDLIIEFAKMHKHLETEICFFINLTNVEDKIRLEKLYALLESNKLTNYIFINADSLVSALPVIKNSFSLIRPTNTDGNAVSILEALYFNIPVIASDAVPRPKSCLLFKNRDVCDLADKILYAVENKAILQAQINEKYDTFERIMKVYEFVK